MTLAYFSSYTRSVEKKQETKLLPITSPNNYRFSIFFADRLSGKYATNSCTIHWPVLDYQDHLTALLMTKSEMDLCKCKALTWTHVKLRLCLY